MPSFADARALAEQTLADHLPDRWRHTQAVAREAIRLAALPEVDREPLIAAAVLHDVGYSPVVARTGFHPLDGARFLATRGYDRRVTALVAHHSGAAVEARLRVVTGLERFDDEATATRDALWYCDAVCGATGIRTTPDERWAEIRRRYGPDHVVSRFLDDAETQLRGAVDRTRARMDIAGVDAFPNDVIPDDSVPDQGTPDDVPTAP
jgi:putative nucleotidyltransferase with HDIG domain